MGAIGICPLCGSLLDLCFDEPEDDGGDYDGGGDMSDVETQTIFLHCTQRIHDDNRDCQYQVVIGERVFVTSYNGFTKENRTTVYDEMLPGWEHIDMTAASGK